SASPSSAAASSASSLLSAAKRSANLRASIIRLVGQLDDPSGERFCRDEPQCRVLISAEEQLAAPKDEGIDREIDSVDQALPEQRLREQSMPPDEQVATVLLFEPRHFGNDVAAHD